MIMDRFLKIYPAQAAAGSDAPDAQSLIRTALRALMPQG